MSELEDTRPRRKERPPKVTSEILDRQPPCSVEAEMAVLGSILLLPDNCDEVALILRPDDFYDDANRRLYEHILKMYDAGQKIDLMLLIESLKSAGHFDLIGGAAYLNRVRNAVATPAHAVYYAQIVRSKATFRSLILASTEILREAYDESQDPREMLSRAEQKIFSILDSRGSSNVANITDVLNEALDRMDARMRGEHIGGGVETGYHRLDEMTGGLHNSELIVLAARPSMGKTALAMNVAEYAAMELKAPTLFVSLEMSAVELADRLLCSVARVNGHRLRNGTISNEDRSRLVEKAALLAQSPLYVDDSPSRSVTEIAAAARRIHRRDGKLGLIVVDYLQLIEPDNSRDPRQEQVARMTRRLKGLARDMDVPVLCLAQLNRQAEVSKDNRPKLSHLRESGAIEQDADVVMFVHREEYYRRGEDAQQFAGQAEIIVAKQRNGPVGDVELTWRKEFTRFENPPDRQYNEFEQFNAPGGEAEFV
ncbi:MAG: replicative DNA helicase [Planctomycetes bacterium]|nr:replicative DNA helicase [Planctomycetota bacterium]